jgi:hypothetical protein
MNVGEEVQPWVYRVVEADVVMKQLRSESKVTSVFSTLPSIKQRRKHYVTHSRSPVLQSGIRY